MGGGLNTYVYSAGEPIGRYDRNGLKWVDAKVVNQGVQNVSVYYGYYTVPGYESRAYEFMQGTLWIELECTDDCGETTTFTHDDFSGPTVQTSNNASPNRAEGRDMDEGLKKLRYQGNSEVQDYFVLITAGSLLKYCY